MNTNINMKDNNKVTNKKAKNDNNHNKGNNGKSHTNNNINKKNIISRFRKS